MRLAVLFAVVGILSIGAIGFAQTVPTFLPPESYGTGANPMLPAVADFNGDGNLDLVVANSNGASVSVLLGNGDGTFREREDYDSGLGPTSIGVGDFNRDGAPDVAVANADAGGIGILPGKGDGTLQPLSADIALGSSPNWLIVADVNGDGNADLVVTMTDRVVLLLGDGGGSFPTLLETPLSTCACSDRLDTVVVADFDGDGKLDLAVNGANAVAILLGNGDGTFRRGENVGSNPGPMAVGDFDGDGRMDLVVAYRPARASLGGFLSLYLGRGDGTFTFKFSGEALKGPGNPVVADFDGDGKLDVAAKGLSNSSVKVMQGNGDGTLKPAVELGTQFLTNLLAVADLDRNGTPDLVESNGPGNSLGVLMNASGRPTMALPTASVSLALDPARVLGANPARGTVTLAWPAASDTVVKLDSSDPAVASVPSSVTVPAGRASASFEIEVQPDAGDTDAVIAAASEAGSDTTAVLVVLKALDTVDITRAEFRPDELRVEATSTDPSATLSLYVTSTGQFLLPLSDPDGGGRFEARVFLPENPGNVTVRSSLGGARSTAVVAR